MAFFVWTATLGKILTLKNLRERHIIIRDWCSMCKKSRETIDLLLHYEVARNLWVLIFRLFGFKWVMLKGWLSCWCAVEVSWEADVDQKLEVGFFVHDVVHLEGAKCSKHRKL